MPKNDSILRWAIPPGISLAIHAILIVLLVVLGSRAASLVRQQPEERRPLSELELIAPPSQSNSSTPQDVDQSEQSPSDSTQSQEPKNTTPTQSPPNALDRSARALNAPTPVVTQAMSAATLSELARESGSLSAEPNQAPAPISFAGVSTGAARSIVYVIDTSGSTMTSLTYIRERLLQSIDRLSPTQRFQVIAFRELADSKIELPPIQARTGSLPRATRENKQAVADWLKQMPARGRSNPVAGLSAALELKPDMVLLIARGIERTQAPWAGGLKAVRQELDTLNPLDPISGTRPVVIKTIQLLDEDPTGIMRTIGVFHGDGLNDHQIITYDQLVNPDPEPTQPPANTSANARLSSAEDQLSTLKATGALYRARFALPSEADRQAINQALSRINSTLSRADLEDPRAALLWAEASLLSNNPQDPNTIESLYSTLNDSVFVAPDLDARRRIILAEMLEYQENQDEVLQKLESVLHDRDQLKISDLSAARAVLAIARHTEPASEHLTRPPFTTDPAWMLMYAQTRTHSLIEQDRSNAFLPLLTLREAQPGMSPIIDQSIAQFVDQIRSKLAPSTPLNELPELVRFIDARAHLSIGTQEDRLSANYTLLELAQSDDRKLASESLWLACLGARSLNTRDSAPLLISAASELAKRFPDHAGAPDALAGAIDTAREFRLPALTPLLRQATSIYPDRIEIDLWRLELAQSTQGQEQLELISALTPATRESDLGAQIIHVQALSAHHETAESELESASRTAALFDRLRSPLARSWHRAAAELELSEDSSTWNPSSATQRLAPLVPHNPDPSNPALELLYAQALLGDGQPDIALDRLSTLVAALKSNTTKDFWHAWTLILETIATQGNAPDKEAAMAHLTRLRLIDPNLGPEPYGSRLMIVQNTLHSEP